MLTERRTRFRFFVWQMFLLFSLELFYVGILGGISLVLNLEKEHQILLGQDSERYQSEEKKLRMFEEKFRATNKLSDAIFSVDKNRFYFTNVFVLLDQYMSEKITFEHISTKEYQVFLSGIAETRDDLLVFHQKLKEEKCFSQVNLPLSNLLTQENVSFQMDITVQESCVHAPSI